MPCPGSPLLDLPVGPEASSTWSFPAGRPALPERLKEGVCKREQADTLKILEHSGSDVTCVRGGTEPELCAA